MSENKVEYKVFKRIELRSLITKIYNPLNKDDEIRTFFQVCNERHLNPIIPLEFAQVTGKCESCIWCYYNGTLNEWCNSEFVCKDHSQHIDNQIYYLDDNQEPRRKCDNKTWVEIMKEKSGSEVKECGI